MKAFLVVLVASALAIALGGTALAHADLVSSVPAAGSTVATAPATVTLTFSEELGSGTVGTIQDAKGAIVSAGSTIAGADHKQIAITLKSGIPNGTYKVTYMAMAMDDGDMTEGSLTFTVGAAAPAPVSQPAPAPATPKLPNTSTSDSDVAAALAIFLGAAAILGISLAFYRARGRAS